MEAWAERHPCKGRHEGEGKGKQEGEDSHSGSLARANRHVHAVR
jgi:hypothetical protein